MVRHRLDSPLRQIVGQPNTPFPTFDVHNPTLSRELGADPLVNEFTLFTLRTGQNLVVKIRPVEGRANNLGVIQPEERGELFGGRVGESGGGSEDGDIGELFSHEAQVTEFGT